jgi:hypothetical protein
MVQVMFCGRHSTLLALYHSERASFLTSVFSHSSSNSSFDDLPFRLDAIGPHH